MPPWTPVESKRRKAPGIPRTFRLRAFVCLQSLAVAVLVLLARTAGAGIVAADLLLGMYGHGLLLLALSGLCCGLHARCLEFVYVDFGALDNSALPATAQYKWFAYAPSSD